MTLKLLKPQGLSPESVSSEQAGGAAGGRPCRFLDLGAGWAGRTVPVTGTKHRCGEAETGPEDSECVLCGCRARECPPWGSRFCSTLGQMATGFPEDTLQACWGHTCGAHRRGWVSGQEPDSSWELSLLDRR